MFNKSVYLLGVKYLLSGRVYYILIIKNILVTVIISDRKHLFLIRITKIYFVEFFILIWAFLMGKEKEGKYLLFFVGKKKK